MRISGFIDVNYDGWATIDNVKFADIMYNIAKDNGFAYEYEWDLGGRRAGIKNCKIVMYTSKHEMTFDEAQSDFLNKMFGAEGMYEMHAAYTGYSEWTITGFDLEKCRLGGHDLNQILLSHIGEYANIEVECI